jgi:hypothetical protein
MKRTWQDYRARLCLRQVLNKLKEMNGLIYTPLGTQLKETFKEASMCSLSKEAFRKLY